MTTQLSVLPERECWAERKGGARGDGCWGLAFLISGGMAWPVVLRAAQTVVLSLARAGVSSKSRPAGLVFGTWARADILAMGGDQKVNWGQGEIFLLPPPVPPSLD